MTETERVLCTDYREIRRTDICLLAIESYYKKLEMESIAKDIHKFRKMYLHGFMARIREERAKEC